MAGGSRPRPRTLEGPLGLSNALPSRIDRVGVLVALAATGVFLLHGFRGNLGQDAAVYAYAGQRVADGVPPYVGILNRSGPLAHLVPGVGALVGRVVGTDDLLAMRVLLALVSVASVWLAYLVARDWCGSRLAGLVAGTTMLTFGGFVHYATYGPREKTTMIFCILLTLWAIGRRRWVTAGVGTALATLTWQGAFFPLVVAALVALLLLPGRRSTLSALGRYLGAGVVVTAVTLLGFWVVGALRAFLEGFLLVNLGYTEQRGLLEAWARVPEILRPVYGWSTVLLIGGSLACVVLAALAARRLDRASPTAVGVVATGAGVLAELGFSLTAFQGWPDALVFVPFAALGTAGVLHLLTRALDARARRAVLAVASVALLVAAAQGSWSTRNTLLEEQREQAHALLAVTGPEATVLSIGSPQPLVLADLDNPIRHQMFLNGMTEFVDDTRPGGLEQLVEDLERIRPTIIAVDRPVTHDWLQPLLAEDYVRLGGSRASVRWFVIDTLSREDVRRARELVHAGPLTTEVPLVGRSGP
ncbi:hypothetical protein EXE57_16290 [Nocardioides euryhalodurans]|uniref:Glycosyltransferase RgtA/B/C/D-like domain-containing protein n=1 Tax=Nocardioides euryhalodurans TaxID=2518370 RepID=A0A4P7GNW4_9ACTN|nr:hypothetical protein EXE57_16290 [Nocardioides euryhalodurans]